MYRILHIPTAEFVRIYQNGKAINPLGLKFAWSYRYYRYAENRYIGVLNLLLDELILRYSKVTGVEHLIKEEFEIVEIEDNV